jgi:hypothetical protein
MLLMIPLIIQEVAAVSLFLARTHREGQSLWHAFWKGGTLGRAEGLRLPRLPGTLGTPFPPFFRGVTPTWSLMLSALLAIWLMVAPGVLGAPFLLADSNRLIGTLALIFSVVTMGEIIRVGRFINILYGAWILASPWVFGGASAAFVWSNFLSGILLILFSLPRGRIRDRYGSWDRYIV